MSFNPCTYMECDSSWLICTGRKLCFNPRTHTECDDKIRMLGKHVGCFNPRTHTECDAFQYPADRYLLCFNPRTHTECDDHIEDLRRKGYVFQSTYSHGVRLHLLQPQAQQGFPGQKVRTSNSAYRKLDKNTTQIAQSLTQLGVRTSRGFAGSFRFALFA